MSDWPDGLTMRPLGTWPGTRTKKPRRSPFSAKFAQTLRELTAELKAIRATGVALEVAIPAGEKYWRNDGRPRAHARADHEGIVLEFKIPEHARPLRYGVDRFDRWQDNLRAVALGLHDLRRLDRYGIAERGQQYRGWAELPSGRPAADPEAGRRIVVSFDYKIRRALAATHPDTRDPDGPYTDDDYRNVVAYKEITDGR